MAVKRRAKKFDDERVLLPDTQYTATASITGPAVDTTNMLSNGIEVDVNVSELTSGTTHSIDVWLQGSIDGGTTWCDIAPDVSWVTGADQNDVTVVTTTRNLNGGSAKTAAFKAKAKMRLSMPLKRLRAELTLTGASPSCKINAKLRGAKLY